MNSQFIKFFATVFIIALFASCATTPQVQVERPWTRTLGQAQSIELGSSIFINVSGDEEYLLIDNPLMDNSVYNVIKNQLVRRDFEIVSSKNDAEYVLNVEYQSKDVQVMQTELSSFQSSYQQSASGSGYGVLAALAVSEQTSSNQSVNQAEVSTQTAYRHTLGFSITQNDQTVWTGESTWKSSSLDVSNRITSTTQLLLSKLPGYGEVTPRVKAVNPEKKNNYYNQFIKGNSFFGPSLPYLINFYKLSGSRTGPNSSGSRTRPNQGLSISESNIARISNPRILHAIVDLIQTAEYALPKEPNYENPISTSQWAKVKLGGEYYIGNDDEKTYIIVNLVGDKTGYNIDSASKVNRQEYNRFLNDLKKWITALNNYYEVFE
ncbi:DUF4136 domain-containing protein [Fodinibius halophilus]|uniref:DUF4136 domain-containing protein n=1 Tax=Fodinibius halophilus TaxID=1736908 RepID=A0A6M1T9U0_9BACT|nr:DUF4136 domain-containing protein [Fodinibius halophilus]NGP90265.1 DUF4136 domain-containing protein [Fodinibius halophilus]